MDAPGGSQPGRPGIGRPGRPPRRGMWGVTRSILLLEHAQDVVTVAVGIVLILIEIVHIVVLSLYSHRLVAQPFIVVGLVAVIRKILFVLSGEKLVSASVLALLIAMVAVFVLSLILVNRFEKSPEPDGL
jgi:uncharacterized membrane protein (DUF373 family)